MNYSSVIKVIVLMSMLLITIAEAMAQKKDIITNIKLYYIDSSSQDRKELNDSVFVYFESGFNESLEVSYRGEVLLKDSLIVDKSIGTTSKYVVCKKVQQVQEKGFVIKLLDSGSNLDFVLDFRYKYLFVHYKKDYWVLIYRNSPVIRE